MYDSKLAHFWPELAESLAARGLSSLRFDFTGNGESEGEFKYGNIIAEVWPWHSISSQYPVRH